MPKKKEEHKHIADKDKGDDVSKILGDMMQETSNKLLSATFDKLLVNTGKGEKAWYQSQMSSLNAFKLQVNKMAEEEKKRLLKASKQGSKELNLTQKQTTKITKEVDKGVNELKKAVVSSYVGNVASIYANAKVLKSNVTEGLYKTIRDKLEKTQKYGIVAYKNGRGVRWENYMEMKVRTDIQNDITKNMIKDGAEIGNVFYIAAYFGDCAKDHVEAQGKIYVDENWQSNAPKDRINEITAYISSKDIKTVQSISEEAPYLTTRPNCRHYFQMISIDEVLGIKNDKDLNAKREEFGLNFNGKYKPEKYKALQEQRYNERNIRHWKGKLEADQKLLDKMPSTMPENERLLLQSRISSDKYKIRQWQARQRELIKANPDVLERNYDREAYNRMRSDFGIRKELKEVDKEISKVSVNVFSKAKNIEPILTKDIVNAVECNGGYCAGLDYRLKTKESLARKIKSEYLILKNDPKYEKISFNYLIEIASENMHDVNRYTAILEPNTFVDSYFKINEELGKKGYKLYKCKNTFKETDATYRGINNQYIKDGQFLELQFHTKESFELKNGLLHKLYEEERLDSTTPERKIEIREEEIKLSKDLKIPENIGKI